MKKIIFSISIVVFLFVFLAGCSKPQSQGATGTANAGDKPAEAKKSNTVEIGVVLPTKQEPRWIQDEERFNNLLLSTNHNVEILFSEGSSSTEKKNVETLITKGIKVLIICAQDAGAAAASIEEAKQAGITVISYDRLITGTDAIDYYISFDSVQVGVIQGTYLVNQLNGQTGQSLYLYSGAASDNNAFLFFQGAWKALQPHIANGDFIVKNSSKANEFKDVADLSRDQMSQIIQQITTEWDQNTSKTKAETDSFNASGTVYILAPNDTTARPIYDVYSATVGVTKVFITGQDSEKPSIQYILDGKQSMTVLKDVRKLVKGAVDTATNILEGKPIETNTTYNNGKKDIQSLGIDIISVDKDNVQAAIFDSGYYSKADFTS